MCNYRTTNAVDIPQVRFTNSSFGSFGSFDSITQVSAALTLIMLFYILTTCVTLFNRVFIDHPVSSQYSYGSLDGSGPASDVTL